MADIGSLVSTDSRTPLERLRRCQLWAIAEDRGIQYPPDAPKTVMLALLEGAGVDLKIPYQGAGLQWKVINGQDEHGHAHQEVYPVHKQPAVVSPEMDVVSATAKIAEPEPEPEPVKAGFQFPLDKLLPWQLNHMCRDFGIDATGMTKPQMIELLEQTSGENTT